MLEAAGRKTLVGGNIGTPLSAQVDQSTADTIHVVETSSFQLETTTTFHPWISVWLNFAADHLDRHPTEDAYAAAKARIFANQDPNDWAVLNADDHEVIDRARGTSPRQVLFSLEGVIANGFVVDGAAIVHRTGTAVERLIPLAAVELTGRHMLNNVLAAAAATHIAGVRPEAMLAALRGFHGLPHVMEPAGQIGSVRFVNDSKATNVEAARRSIESFDGGRRCHHRRPLQGGDFGDLRGALTSRGRAVVAIGEAAARVRAALEGTLPVRDAASMTEAVQRGYEAARPDGVVLLAPACSSFDWFRDYAERGEVFKEEVRRLRERVGDTGKEERKP
jgi:UDP-N-acetylmuramoylalanine--D-glutamate ligase